MQPVINPGRNPKRTREWESTAHDPSSPEQASTLPGGRPRLASPVSPAPLRESEPAPPRALPPSPRLQARQVSERPSSPHQTPPGRPTQMPASMPPLTLPAPLSQSAPSAASTPALAPRSLLRPTPVAAAAIALTVQRAHPTYSVMVNGEVVLARALAVQRTGDLLLRHADASFSGLLAADVEQHLVLALAGPVVETAPGPGPRRPAQPAWTGLIMVDPYEPRYLEQAESAVQRFTALAGAPDSITVGVATEDFIAVMESEMDQFSNDELIERYDIRQTPPADLPEDDMDDWLVERIAERHNERAFELADRFGGEVVPLPHDAVFMRPDGTLDRFEGQVTRMPEIPILAVVAGRSQAAPATTSRDTGVRAMSAIRATIDFRSLAPDTPARGAATDEPDSPNPATSPEPPEPPEAAGAASLSRDGTKQDPSSAGMTRD